MYVLVQVEDAAVNGTTLGTRTTGCAATSGGWARRRSLLSCTAPAARPPIQCWFTLCVSSHRSQEIPKHAVMAAATMIPTSVGHGYATRVVSTAAANEDAEEGDGTDMWDKDLEAAGNWFGNSGKRLLDATKHTARDVIRPVLMPIQQVGRRGRQASMSALARSLPRIVEASLPKVRQKLEEIFRDWALGRIDVNQQWHIPDHIALAVELSEEILGPARAAEARARSSSPTTQPDAESSNSGSPTNPWAAVRRTFDESRRSLGRAASSVGSTAHQALGTLTGGSLGYKEPEIPEIIAELQCTLTNVSRAVAHGAEAGSGGAGPNKAADRAQHGAGPNKAAGRASPPPPPPAPETSATPSKSATKEPTTAPKDRRSVTRIAFETGALAFFGNSAHACACPYLCSPSARPRITIRWPP